MKSSFSSVSLVLALFYAMAPLRVDATDWPTLRRDTMRSGISTDTIFPPILSETWSVRIGSSVDASPAVTQGRLYVGNAEGEVICLNVADGASIWRTSTQGAVVSSPAVYNGTVFVGSVDRCLYAFDALSGKIRWRVRTWLPVVASPLILNRCVYIGSMDGSFKCVNAADGNIIWEQSAGPVSGSAAGSENVVYYGDEEGNVFARQADDGELLWSAKVEGSIIRAPVVTETRVIFGVMSPSALRAPKIDYLIAYERNTGEKMWAHNDQHSVMHTPIADAGRLYYATVSGYTSTSTLFCCQVDDGRQLWKRSLAGVADSSPVLTAEYLLMGVNDGIFHVYEKSDGAEVHSVHVGAKIFSTPAIVDGAVYFGSGDGLLHCLRCSDKP